jgi:hypothetical protein
MTILKDRPYSLEILIDSNTESEERNFLKMKILFDLQNSYPDCVPYYRLKNLSPDFMDNRFIDRCETLLRSKGDELIGSMMIFEMCDLVKELMTNINDEVLQKLDHIAAENSVENALKTTETSKHLNYTPVNNETFKVWCDAYKERLRIEREKNDTGLGDKPSGRQLFETKKQTFEDLTLDGNEETFDTQK